MANNSSEESHPSEEPPFDFCKTNICPAYIFSEINLGIGLIGNVLSLLAFMKMSKLNQGYIYQILIILLDLFCIPFSFLAYGTDFHFMVWENLAPPLIQNSPFLLRISVLGYEFENMNFTTFLIALLCISGDRWYALKNPMKYKTANHKRRVKILAAISLFIGIILSIPDCFMMTTEQDPESDSYLLVERQSYTDSFFVQIVGYFRFGLRLALIFATIIASIGLVVSYRKAQAEHRRISKPTTNEKQKMIDEKALALLLISQTIFVIAAFSIVIAWYFNLYVYGMDWADPVQLTINSWTNVGMSACRGYNFIFYFILSKEFRNAVMAVLKREELKTAKANVIKKAVVKKVQVAPTSGTNANTGQGTSAEATV